MAAAPRDVPLSEVARHRTAEDCWVAIDGVVYDLTAFLPDHPGGKAVLLQEAGTDATAKFNVLHDAGVLDLVKDMRVGRLAAGAGPGADPAAAADDDAPDRAHPPSIRAASLARRIADAVLSAGGDVAGIGAALFYNGLVFPYEWIQRTIAPIRPLQPGTAERPVRVCVVGAGAGGLTAAWALSRTGGYELTVLEAQAQLGGHSFTYPYRSPGGGEVPVDMGFIFGNHRSYSNQLGILKHIGGEIIDTELSLSVDIEGCRYATDGTICDGMKGPTKVHPQGQAEAARFHALCERWWDNAAFNLVPFGWFLTAYGFSQDFRDLYLTPTLITLFISKDGLYGMSSRFMFNMFGGPNKYVDLLKGWKCFTLKGGTNPGWIQRLAAGFQDRCRTNAKVKTVRRVTEKGRAQVAVEWEEGGAARRELFDHVLFGCGGMVAGQLLQDKGLLERAMFSQIRYEGEHLVLHGDQSFLPKDKSLWRNFNYKDRKGYKLPELTGSMAHVSRNVDQVSDCPPILTMNPKRQPKGKIHYERFCAVHVQDLRHLLATRLCMPAIQGAGGVWYCGSWANWFGHSGAIDAGFAAAAALGAAYPVEDPVARDEFFMTACYEMFGPRFDSAAAVRKHDEMKQKAKL